LAEKKELTPLKPVEVKKRRLSIIPKFHLNKGIS